jgi:hypothetical protein
MHYALKAYKNCTNYIIYGLMFCCIGLFDNTHDYILQFTILHTHIHTHSPQSCLYQPLLSSSFQWTFHFLWVPELFSASATSFSQQQLIKTELQQFTDWLTPVIHQSTNSTQLNWLQFTVLLIISWHRLHTKHSIFYFKINISVQLKYCGM